MRINKFNIHCIVEARTSSKRLPNKVLKNLKGKEKVIDYVIKNLLKSKINKRKVIIVIPKNKNNDELKKYLKKKYNLKIFRGSEKNVYKRVSDCCKKYKVQNFIRITADNVLLDPILINKAIQFYIQNNSDYLSTRTMDHTNKWNVTSDYNEGSSIEIINVKNLFNISKLVRKKDREYPTWHIFSNPKNFNLKKLSLINDYKKIASTIRIKKIRTTLDTKEDYFFLRQIIKKLDLKPGENNFLKILKNFKKIEKFLLINKKIKKKIAYKVIKEN